MRNIFLRLTFLYSSILCSAPWFDSDDQIKYIYFGIEKYCFIYRDTHSLHPQTIWTLENLKKELKANKNTPECNEFVQKLEKYILDSFKTNVLIGYQSKVDKLYLQEKDSRYYLKSNAYIDINSVNNNFAYKLKVIKNNDRSYLDESYIAYKANNNVIKLGRPKRWWSPSSFTSLIYSNSSRPIQSLSISNYKPILLDNKFLSYFGHLNYEIFIGKLETNREIPNALLFGNRFNFSPYTNLNISLLRVAQFGGKGRTINSKVIKNMILGKDTANSRLSFEEQPGNQIAGIDFLYKINKKNKVYIYGQYMGEDGLDPIIDDRWIGAIFPSKRFGMAGISISSKNPNNLWKLTFEHVNTDTGFKNVTYNHGLYKTGYRYHGIPIGAAIDGDSHNSIINYERFYINKSFQIKYQKMKINQNDSHLHSLSSKNFNNEELLLRVSRNYKDKFNLTLNYIIRSSTSKYYDNNNFFIRVEKRI